MGNKKENQKTLQIRMIRSRTVSWINRFVAVFFRLPAAALALSFHSSVICERIRRFRFCDKKCGYIPEFPFLFQNSLFDFL